MKDRLRFEPWEEKLVLVAGEECETKLYVLPHDPTAANVSLLPDGSYSVDILIQPLITSFALFCFASASVHLNQNCSFLF